MEADALLTPRQRNEREYHRDHAAQNAEKAFESVDLFWKYGQHRWWNAYWELYRLIRREELANKRILVVGCGFGEDAIRLSALGAEVHAFDLSAESVEIASLRASNMSRQIRFAVAPAEKTPYPDAFFDAALFLDILHHVDIAAAMRETRRVLKPHALIFGDELYTHSMAERVRQHRMVREFLYPKMRRFIYGSDTPYITADEHKIDEHEFAIVRSHIVLRELHYFDLFLNRLVPNRFVFAAKLDRLLLRAFGPLGRYASGRIVFVGTRRP